jgi:hypothetical protein
LKILTEEITLKKRLLEKCLEMQQMAVDTAKAAMLDAQETANDQPVSMGDKYESFREMMQIDRDMYAQRYDEGLQLLNTLKKIDPDKTNPIPALGTIVKTDSSVFFVSASLGQVTLDGETYLAISMQSPIFKTMAGKKAGEEFSFRDKKYNVLEVL